MSFRIRSSGMLAFDGMAPRALSTHAHLEIVVEHDVGHLLHAGLHVPHPPLVRP